MLTGDDDIWPCQCQVKVQGGYQDGPVGECCQEYEAPRQLPRIAPTCNPFDQRKVLSTEHVTTSALTYHGQYHHDPQCHLDKSCQELGDKEAVPDKPPYKSVPHTVETVD